VDDHQAGLAETLATHRLASVLDLEHPSRRLLSEAAGRSIVPPASFCASASREPAPVAAAE
jgi:hypothetical protein